MDIEELKKDLRGFGPADHDYPVIVRALAAIEQLQERLERAEARGRSSMRDDIIKKLASYEADKCAQIAAGVPIEEGKADPKIAPDAWLRVSSIAGTVRGVFPTQDVELKSEKLVPLYRNPPEKVHFSEGDIMQAINQNRNHSPIWMLRTDFLQLTKEEIINAFRSLLDRAQRPKQASSDGTSA